MSDIAASDVLPDGLLVSFYGDDFTGSTSVMEALTFAGLPTVLFLDTPTAAQLAGFAGYRGIGIAGIARSQSPDWMAAHLPQVFETHGSAQCSHCTLQSLLDLRLGTAGRVDRAGDRSCGSCARRRMASAHRRGSSDWALPGLRKPVCRRGWRWLPARPASDHVLPPDNPHGRGGCPPPPPEAD